MRKAWAFALVLIGLAGSAQAQPCSPGAKFFTLEFGNSWGHAMTTPTLGSSLDAIGRITKSTQSSAPLVYDMTATTEYTFYITGVTLDAYADAATDTFFYGAGGSITVYEDLSKDGPRPPTASPPNGNVPSLFTDGTAVLVGTIDNLFVTWAPNSPGPAFRGEIRGGITFTGGTMLAQLISPTWIWNGTATANFGGSVPAGYNFLWGGKIDNTCPPTATEATTWGNIKSLYN